MLHREEAEDERERWCRDLSGTQQERPDNKRSNKITVLIRQNKKGNTNSK